MIQKKIIKLSEEKHVCLNRDYSKYALNLLTIILNTVSSMQRGPFNNGNNNSAVTSVSVGSLCFSGSFSM